MDPIFRKYSKFILIYIDNILVFSHNLKKKHYDHLLTIFNEFFYNGLIELGMNIRKR